MFGTSRVDCISSGKLHVHIHHISLIIRHNFFLPKQSQKSRSVLQDRSRSLGLFRKGKTRIITKFRRTDVVICSQFREGKTLSYS